MSNSDGNPSAASGDAPVDQPDQKAGGKKGFNPGALLTGIRTYIGGLSSKPRTRYLTVLWGFCFIFLGISLLSASNPFRLYIPGAVYPRPILDARKPVKVFGVKDDLKTIVPVNRRMLLEGPAEVRVRRMAFLMSRPVGLREKSDAAAANLAPMPNLGLAVRKVWFVDKSKAGRVIVDMRRAGIDAEFVRFIKARRSSRRTGADKKNDRSRRNLRKQKAEQEKLEARYLDGWFRALTASALATPEVRSIRFLLDGQVQRVRGMEFDLRAEHTTVAPAKSPAEKK